MFLYQMEQQKMLIFFSKFLYLFCVINYFLFNILKLYRYDIKCTSSPLLIHSQAYCKSDEENANITLIHYDFKFCNTSNIFDITQIVASIQIPEYEKILSSDYLTSDGTKSKLKVTVTNGSRNLSITSTKIKCHSEISLSLVIKVILLFILFFCD